MVLPIPAGPGALWGLSLWDFSPHWGPGAVLAQAQPQHRHDVCAEQIHPDRWATRAFQALCKYFSPHTPIFHIPLEFEFPWHLLFLPLYPYTSHCWDGERNAVAGSVGCVAYPREGLAFFVSIFKSLSFCLSQVLEFAASGNIWEHSGLTFWHYIEC